MKQMKINLLILLCIGAILLSVSVQGLVVSPQINYEDLPTDKGNNYAELITGNTFYVSNSGNDQSLGTKEQPFQTINHALNVAKSGDGIFVRKGVYKIPSYSERIEVNQNNIILAAYPGEKPVIRSAGSSWGVLLFGDNIIFDGFTIEGFSIAVAFGRDNTQQNLVVKNIEVNQSGESFSAIYIPNHNNNLPVLDGGIFDNINVHDPEGSIVIGIHCGGHPCNNIHIKNSQINLAGLGGGSGADGIAMEYGDNILIENVLIEGAAGDGIDMKASHVAVINSIIKDISRNGVKFWRGGDLINSVVANTGADSSFVFAGPGEYRIIHSTIAHHNKNGLISYTATVGYESDGSGISLEIRNSIFHENVGSVWINPKAQLTIKDSIFSGGTQTGRYLDYGESYGLNTQPLSSLDAGLIEVADVGFLDFPNDLLALQASSPALDKGSVSLAKEDILGTTRVEGSTDIGPLEHDTSPTLPPPPSPPPEEKDYLALINFDGEDNEGLTFYGGEVVTGHNGNGYQFDGVNDYLLFDKLNLNQEFSVAFWAKNDERRQGAYLYSYGAKRARLILKQANRYLRYIYGNDLLTNYIHRDIRIDDKQWHHYALVVEGNTVHHLYIDGVEQRSFSTERVQLLQKLYIGSIKGKTQFFKGIMDEIYLYDRALLPEEVSILAE